MFKGRTYLDWAAAAPISARAARAFSHALAAYGNPSSPHEEGRKAREILEDARIRIARLLEAKPDAVIFTGSATEANALAIRGLVRGLRAAGRESIHMLYLPTAHASVHEAMRAVQKEGVATEALKLKDGALDLTSLRAQIRPETALISLERVCGETGMLIDAKPVKALIEELQPAGSRALIHVDASQSSLFESIERTRLSADLITLDASKVGGVRGIGVLLAPRHVSLAPVYEGGGQERGLRSGTESPALASAFATALEECKAGHEAFEKHARRKRTDLASRIGAVVNEGKDNAPHILNVSFPGIDTDYLVALLDAAGFAVSTRSACETDADGSRVVLAMTGDAARAQATLRISWGPSTKEGELTRFADALLKETAFLERSGIAQ